MSEWWTYRLSSFLLFAPRTYYRLFELYNASIWPAQVAAAGLGFCVAMLLRRGSGPMRARAVPAILAACWLWVAVAFLARRYASINFAATEFAWAFGVEAALLVWLGVARATLEFARPPRVAGRIGFGLLLFALLAQPLLGPALGRSWRQAEIFGVAPDPTAVATLGILLLARGRLRWALMIVPAAWCVFTGATLLAMKAPDWCVGPAAAVTAIMAAIRREGGLAHRSDASAA